MPLTPVILGDNVQAPSATAVAYNPDQLIAGNLKLVTDTATIGTGKLTRGTVLGQITASGNYIVSVRTANDGSQVPLAILADDVDASGGAVQGPIYLQGEFNQTAITFDASWTLAQLKTAMRPYELYLKTVVSATDPS